MKPAKSAAAFPLHVEPIYDDRTVKGGLEKAVYDARKLGGQALAIDWSKCGRFFAIKEGRKFQEFCIKLIEFEGKSKETNRGLLLLGVWVMEYLVFV